VEKYRGFAPRDDEAVDVLQLFWIAHQDGLGTEFGQPPTVRVKVTLKG
jgi:hypothetical protein